MAETLDCKAVSQAIKDNCKKEADALRAKGIVPKLGIVRVGEKGPDLSYGRGRNRSRSICFSGRYFSG